MGLVLNAETTLAAQLHFNAVQQGQVNPGPGPGPNPTPGPQGGSVFAASFPNSLPVPVSGNTSLQVLVANAATLPANNVLVELGGLPDGLQAQSKTVSLGPKDSQLVSLDLQSSQVKPGTYNAMLRLSSAGSLLDQEPVSLQVQETQPFGGLLGNFSGLLGLGGSFLAGLIVVGIIFLIAYWAYGRATAPVESWQRRN